MKKIGISINNRVFAESILIMLKQTGDFRPIPLPSTNPEMMKIECLASEPEILLLDVTEAMPEMSLNGRLSLIREIHKDLPECKTALLCDEIAYPDLARGVMRAKQTGQIDAFFYASVTAEYLVAALNTL